MSPTAQCGLRRNWDIPKAHAAWESRASVDDAVMNDLRKETLIPLTSISKHLKNTRRNELHYRVILRWCLNGVGGHTLESVQVRGRLHTSVEALQRWLHAREAATGAASGASPVTRRSGASSNSVAARSKPSSSAQP